MKKYYHRIFSKKFDKIWKKIRNTKKIDPTLRHITDNFINSKSYKTVSNYWHIRNIQSFEWIAKFGIDNYGSTIAPYYFTFARMHHDEWFDVLIENLKDESFNIESDQLFKKQKNFSLNDSIGYNYLCYLLYYSLKKNDYYKHLKTLNDNTYLGFDDPFISIDNINVSTDKIVSLFDCEKIFRTFKDTKLDNILEIGAGSGRTSEAIISMKKNSKYIICDIPPAIYISYKRLKIAFPDKKISLLLDIDQQDELENKIKESDISFIFPDHLKFLKKDFINLTIAIDCMHEMDKSTIKYYLGNINRFSENFYFSVWEKTKVPFSKNIFKQENILDVSDNDYNIPDVWKILLKENLIFPCNQIALGYKIVK